ncbi:TnsA endonuclease N-terminal domain-containing protein [uncultured Pontibacter sp.]|uniref:TnsA endonuclease N-terminal domain-containing protein n=1 Tax=uncultured Pontibacter sp. TaxID=453356 RepID=UPI00263042B8|nr:TnsA endonuclease N-terminal domain-containing protein [uncultured Pontibacter sp.]
MAKKKQASIDFPFYTYLNLFYKQERKKIRSTYRPLTKKFLDFNDPDSPSAYLRRPQFEALEMYVFLKEYCDNQYLFKIFEEWYYKQNHFEGRPDIGVSAATGQLGMFGPSEFSSDDKIKFKDVFEQIKSFQQTYPNYIFALTMGTGKSILMATSIFYEFLLANKYPKDEKYCHNVLVFAPDKTVLQSLKEIQTFDKSKVVPTEYVNWLETNLKFFFLDETGDALNAIERSRFNIIISNTQKIILKKQHKKQSAALDLFNERANIYKAKYGNDDDADLYGFDINSEQDLITNQRFAKLTRLEQLGIYVDEAHHIFGNALAADFGLKNTATSLRVTINELAASIQQAGSKVVGCYNYTGTPYVGSRLLPEVVYSYGLKEAINNKYLKKVKISSFKNIKDQTQAFVRTSINEFWSTYKDKRYEYMLPKMAFFASSIEELEKDLRPAVEQVLSELNIPMDRILVNVGDTSVTTNDDIREFKNLDTPGSNKQFILLVNKGKEGWNCRSLFSVGLHRQPKSRVFVLQATMRCLRAIGDIQETGLVFLSEDNINILNDELQENFKLSVDDLNGAGDKNTPVEVRVVPPPVKVKLKKVNKLHTLREKVLSGTIDLELDKAETDKYKIIRSELNIMDLSKKIGQDKDFTHIKEKREFSELTLVAEISRYLNISPIRVKKILASTKEGITEVTGRVNEFNELLYDWVIPRLFSELFELKEYKTEDEVEVSLVKEPKEQYYRVSAKKELLASMHNETFKSFIEKSFHLDNYCFDSKPESQLFWTLLHDDQVEKVWFTGMLTHGQSDFVVNYVDPESHTLRCYYPDFLVQLKDKSYVIMEVKADHMVDDEVVKAKAAYAQQLANASNMKYQMIKGTEAMAGVGIA